MIAQSYTKTNRHGQHLYFNNGLRLDLFFTKLYFISLDVYICFLFTDMIYKEKKKVVQYWNNIRVNK